MTVKQELTRRQKANAIRALSMDAVERAKSGHPGAPMGMADMAEVLWADFLKHNPKNPNWFNRDRFVLSNGHASMLLYSLLHLTGYDISIDDIKDFRQLHSKTPGHPEYAEAPGVETTTGPLGQGIANAVGFAMAEKLLAARFNKPNYDIVNNHTYVFLGDGCMMEGVSHEVCSLAGTLKLGKLIALWDDNKISIDGNVKTWFDEDTAARFKAYGWHVIENVDGHNSDQIAKAISQAQQNTEQPSLICCRTIIGYGAPTKQDTADVHGAPLGSEEVQNAREAIGWKYEPFDIPNEYYKSWDCTDKGHELESAWNQLLVKYEQEHPDLAKEFLRRMNNVLPENWDKLTTDYICSLQAGQQDVATRKASQTVLEELGSHLPELFGGSADLTGSNGTLWKGAETVSSHNWHGQYMHYGVREFGMTAIGNGLALYGGIIPYSGTFLTFLDYARNAVRMAALMHQRNILVYTHDSLALGEDGPTHQPIEHLAILRATPNVECWRPCDAVETAVAWCEAVNNKANPTALALTRQTVKAQQRDLDTLAQVSKGGYVIAETNASVQPDLVIIATGSEVELAMQAQKELVQGSNLNIRVVSMPCVERFNQQDEDYKTSVISDDGLKRLVIEAGATMPWQQFVQSGRQIIGIDTFGASAPASVLFKHYGFTVDNVVARAREILG